VNIAKVISGGQTGVDRAALDVALELGLPCGGWCPRGRRAEDGPLPERYPLQETPWDGYPQRTEWNVRDSDGTLVLTCGQVDRGTALTIELSERRCKPCLVLDLSTQPSIDDVRQLVEDQQIHILNVAGPRENRCPGIYTLAGEFLRDLFACRGFTSWVETP
jgi:hypothetical protein